MLLQKRDAPDEKVNEPSKVDLYPTIIEEYVEPRTIDKYPLQVPDAPAISNQRQLEKSLKSLRRNFKSLRERELDENKTVNLIVEQTLANPKFPVWIPLFKPTLTRRWLDLVLVIEVNNSLVIWEKTITELRQFLRRLGIFNSCETWGLKINYSPNPRFLEWLLVETIYSPTLELSWLVIYSYLTYLKEGLPELNEGIELFSYDDPKMRSYPPEAINGKGKDTLILLVSDFVSPAWYRSEMSILLRQWGRKGMVNLLQLLPERLWSRTVLGQQNCLQLKATQKIKQNTKLIRLSKEKKTLDNQFKLPVTSLETERLEEWSKFLMGIGNNQCIGYGISPLKRPYTKFSNEISPQERVTRFQSIASPTSLKLAELLSAVLVTLPVIRVIQYTMVPQANQSHIAEVLMGGLFKPLTETVTPNINPDEIEFKFFDGVRDELLSWLTVNEISFAIEQVSSYLADRMGKSLNEFEALLIRSQFSNSNLAKQVSPFAQVSSDVLQKLGGGYAEFANQIRSGLDICTFQTATIQVKLGFKSVTILPKQEINNRPKIEDIYFPKDGGSFTSDSTKNGYRNYEELKDNEQEGKDYLIHSRKKKSHIAIVAHHGGKIQPGTTEIADAIAGEDYNFYSFEGIKNGLENGRLHIHSHLFDEPRALDIVTKVHQVIAIHGMADYEGHDMEDNDEVIYLGGLDNDLKEEVEKSLIKANFKNITNKSYLQETNPKNICNRGQTGQGVQIGLSWGLRKKLFDSLKSETKEPTLFDRFVQAIRDALSPLEAAGWRYQTSEGIADYYTEQLAENVELDMISIPGGSFWMGTDDEEIERLVKKFEWEYFREERPQHQVTIQPFSMGRYPITQGQWKAIAERGDLQVNIDLDPDPSQFKDDLPQPPLEPGETPKTRWDRPVEQVNWYQAQEFCDRLSKLTGKPYRLPTEAEWEYACRSVIPNNSSLTTKDLTLAEWNQNYQQPFHFGQTITGDLANYRATSIYADEPKGEYREQTTPVGYFKIANAFGLYDMHGNVWEWCQDDFKDNYEDVPNDGSAWIKPRNSNIDNQPYSDRNKDNKPNKVIRGGSWDYDPYECRCANRNNVNARDNNGLVGFRVVSGPPRT